MTPPEIRISVCLAAYNGEKYLADQLDSILPQLGIHDELIISDDNSTDATADIIRSFKSRDSRIIFLVNQTQQGPAANFENALRAARGKFIFLSDQDDIWLVDKIERILPLLDNYLLIVHDAIVTDEQLNAILPSYLQYRQAATGFWRNLYKNGFTGCCMAFRRELLDIALPFPPKVLNHDHWLGSLALLFDKVIFIQEPYIYFRRHNNNVSPGIERNILSNPFRLHLRSQMLYHIFVRIIKFKIKKERFHGTR